jgi:hypothetical protein
MAKASKTSSTETKVVLEVKFPQLEPGLSNAVMRSFAKSDDGNLAAGFQKAAAVTTMPSFPIQLIDLDVNAKSLDHDIPIAAGTAHKSTGDVSAARPLSLYLDLTGTPNSSVNVVFELDGKEEFKGELFILSSGRLTILKTLP